ncbi:DUF1653 domain-containing protein [Candidatus Woesearchaeota archaeon]|nr:DUF1653 domain-containing protein [Candidatus Woesearchaeota archaeon]
MAEVKEIKKGRYRHYKGKDYLVLGVAHHSESLEELVVYQALYESSQFGRDAIWARPKGMFFEGVLFEGKRVPRFRFIGG